MSEPISPKQAARRKKPIDDLLDPALFKALSDPTRVRLLGCLVKCGRPCSVTEIAECCSVDFSVVSRHLSMLEKAGVLDATKQGRTVFYAVQHQELGGMFRDLANAIEECEIDCASGDGGCCG